MERKSWSLPALVGSFFFAVFTIIGKVFASFGDQPSDIDSWSQVSFYIPVFFALFALYYMVLRWLLTRDYCKQKACPERLVSNKVFRKAADLLCAHTFLISFLVILAAWIPYIVTFFPGNVPFDGYNQLNQATGIWPYKTGHPLLVTLIFGWLFQLGSIVSDNFGVFTIILVQSFCCSAIYALSVVKVREMCRTITPAIAALAYFSLVPVWASYAQTLMKDALGTGVFALYLTFLLEAVDYMLHPDEKELPVRDWIILFMLSVFVCLMRHNTIYVICPAIFVLVFVCVRGRKRAVALLLLPVAATGIFNHAVVEGVLGVYSTPTRAFYSIVYQQLGKYMQDHPDDLTEEEHEAIGTVIAVDRLAELYHPLYSDPIKNTFSYSASASAENMRAFLSTWAKLFFRHPGTYIEAFLQFCSGYLDPFNHVCILAEFQNYIKEEPVATGDLDIYYVMDNVERRALHSYENAWLELFPLTLLSYPGSYTWIMIFCALILWQKKCYRQLPVMVIPAMHILTCIASPVAGYIRYMLPVMAITPLLLAWTFREVRRAETKMMVQEQTV